MKYKNYSYIIVAILMMLISINSIYANEKTCYYISEPREKELKTAVTIRWGKEATGMNMNKGSSVTVNKFDGRLSTKTSPMLNWGSQYTIGSNQGIGLAGDGCTSSGVCFYFFYTHDELEKLTDPPCPKYMVIEFNTSWGDEYFAWGTDSALLATQAVNSQHRNATYAFASNFKDGKQITEEMYYNTFVSTGTGTIDKSTLSCGEIFTADIKTMISDILQYPKIIVPILLILFGILDFAKATISSKEDEMKKAQSKFIKRLIAGVAVFLVPLLIDIIMEFSNIVWEGMGYTSCNFK